jgi:riboflavin biosynthesis pyrimidine reductase
MLAGTIAALIPPLANSAAAQPAAAHRAAVQPAAVHESRGHDHRAYGPRALMGRMRALLPPDPAGGDADVHRFYAGDWLEPGGLRVNFVSSVDGAVTAGGLSKGLQTQGDNRIFAALRDLADVVVVGASTAAAERYASVHPGGRRLERRREFGMSATLPTAVLSRSLRLDPASDLYTGADDDARTIVLTCERGSSTTRAALEQVADVVICGTDDVDPRLARAALEDRGHTRMLCEGGPKVFASLAAAGVVDELCLSISPVLAGPGAGRITDGSPWLDGVCRLRLRGLLEEDGAVFCRYRTGRHGTDR